MECDLCGVQARWMHMCLRCTGLYCRDHLGAHHDQCIPADPVERRRFLQAREERRRREAEFAAATRHLGLTPPCRDATLTVKLLDDDTDEPLEGLDVWLRVGDLRPSSQGSGDYHFTQLARGEVYMAYVRGTARYGDVTTFELVTAGAVDELTIRLIPFQLRLALDADRDGRVDDPDDDFTTWTRGEDSTGAIVFYNNLNVGNRFEGRYPRLPRVDASDDVTRGRRLDGLCPFELVATGACSRDYVATLEAEPADRIRIFYRDLAFVLGDSAHPMPIPRNGRLPCLLEATGYPGPGFDGTVTLTLKLYDESEGLILERAAVVRVSPWLMHNALDPLVRVYAMDIRNLEGMHETSYGAVGAYLADLETALGDRVERVDFNAYALGKKADLFLRDVMSVGYSSRPTTDGTQHVPVVLGPVHRREASSIDEFPTTLSSPTVGFCLPTGGRVDSDDTSNYYGNFLCSPPTDPHPLGCIFHGINDTYDVDPRFVAFLDAQPQPRCPLDVGWLTIRHVDEILTFVPSGHGRFVIVMPSPALALRLLGDARDADKSARIFAGFEAEEDVIVPTDIVERPTVASLLSDGEFVAAQEFAEAKILALQEPILEALGIGRIPILRLPVLYEPPTDELLPYYRAYTPSVVNMLVGTGIDGTADLCIPKPYGPLIGGRCCFESEIARVLGPTGNRIHWIRNFNMYHQSDGEVHCATNSVRRPPTGRVWWACDG